MKPRIIISKPIALGAIGTILGLVGLASYFIPSTASTAIEPAAATEATAQAAYGKFPLSFESNKGQTDSHVKFMARGSGYTLFLSGSEAVLSLKGGGKETRRKGDKETNKNADQPLPNCTSSGCSSEAFITKLNISKQDPMKPKPDFDQIVYSTYLGGPGSEAGRGIAADINGNAYVTGGSGGTFPSTAGMSTCTDPGVFVAKYNAGGVKQYATCISGLGQDGGMDIDVDPAGCVYVTGGTESYNYPTVNAFQPFFAGGTGATPSDAFVTKLCSGLDHFKCYDVQAQKSFQPFNVILRDQFESQEVTVLRPTTLCNPALKCVPTGNPAKPYDCTQRLNPDDHLVCYETMDERGTPQFEQREVIVSNQFGKEQPLTVLRRKNQLCVPSLKAHVDAKR